MQTSTYVCTLQLALGFVVLYCGDTYMYVYQVVVVWCLTLCGMYVVVYVMIVRALLCV